MTKYTSSKGTSLLCVAAIVLCATTAAAQSAKDSCGPASVIPLTREEAPAKIVVDPPLAEPLASRGVAIIQYCTQNLHLVPVFGPNALAVSPRVGHIHVRVDDASWVWADASGNPIILMGLPPVRTKCSLNWRTRTTTPSTRASSHLSFQKKLRPKSLVTQAEYGEEAYSTSGKNGREHLVESVNA
jgi:hypothetical protein